MNKIIVIFTCWTLLLFAQPCFAAGEVVKWYDISVSKFLLDPNNDILYASTTNDNSIVIINTKTLQLEDTIFVGSLPSGLALSPNSQILYVALRGASKIAKVDTVNRDFENYINLPAPAFDIEHGIGKIYATPGNESVNGIMQIELSTNSVTSIFSEGVFIYLNGMLEISSDRKVLFFANQGLSPGTLAKFDVSNNSPTLILKNPHGDLGSNGQDLALSKDGKYIYYAVGGGNRVTGYYDIAKLNTDTFLADGAFITGAYPREVAISPNGNIVYAIHTSGHIDVWNSNTYLLKSDYYTEGEAYELLTDGTGSYLFAAFENQLRVYSTVIKEPPPPPEIIIPYSAIYLLLGNKP